MGKEHELPGAVGIVDGTHVNFEQNPAIDGYALKYYICTPYRKPAALLPENEVFNVLFSTARVKIEHVNGILKARFTSLKGLRIQVKQLDDFVRVNE